MAFIRHRGKTYSVVYKILDENGEEHTTSATFATQKEADKRKKEIEYKQSIGKFEVQKCVTLKELIEEYVQIERVSKDAIEALNSKEIIMIFPSQKKNNRTVRVLKTPKTDSSVRKVFIPKSVAQCLIDLKADQDEIKEVLGNEYQDYNLVMATTFGLPIGDSYLRTKMQEIIDELGLPDVVFHSLRHTSVTYKLKLSGGDIKAVQGDSGHAQADMVTEVYGHILDEDRRKNAELMENVFYNKENLNPQMKEQDEGSSTITVPDGVDAELVMKVLGNPEMAALLTPLAKTMKT